MAKLPAACPGIGWGSSLTPSYGVTLVATHCWSCTIQLPEVTAKIDELVPAALSKERAAVFFGPGFREVLAAALSNPVGLCPECLCFLRLGRGDLRTGECP